MTSESTDGPTTPDVANPGLMRPPRIFFAAIILGLVGQFLWPVPLLAPAIATVIGAVLIVAAIVLFVSAVRTFKAAGTPVPGNQPATAIVNAGPYRFSRNPIYLAFVVFQLGLAFLLNSLSLVITLAPAFALMAFVVIPREERYLTRRFPGEYAEYKASTRRWL
jgi:protein-S-isoprenylcysteine O-methyltransferase Ste14